MNYNYKKNISELYEKYAEDFWEKYHLTPNFDIIKLFNDSGIEVTPVKSLPYTWEYAFNTESGKLKVYYLENLLCKELQEGTYQTKEELEKYQSNLAYSKRDLRFVLAMALADLLAFYCLKEENLVKEELNGITYCQGSKKNLQKISEKQRECEMLAAYLLMPRDILTEKFYKMVKEHNDGITYDNLWDFGISFGVNPRAIHRRCKVLKLISD